MLIGLYAKPGNTITDATAATLAAHGHSIRWRNPSVWRHDCVERFHAVVINGLHGCGRQIRDAYAKCNISAYIIGNDDIIGALCGTKLPLCVETMHGLGDCIYIRPFIKELASKEHIYLATPWHQLFGDIKNITPVRCRTELRTQKKNADYTLSERPVLCRILAPNYNAEDLEQGSIVDALSAKFGVKWRDADLPKFAPPSIQSNGKPIAVIRPVTMRREWLNEARAPLPEYVAWVASQLMKTHHVVSIADIADGEEWMCGDEPPAHQRFHHGELSVTSLIGLIQSADIVVGGVGWIVPAALATRTRTFVLLGGQGAHNAPEKIGQAPWIGYATPDNFCQCADMRHRCDKTISNLSEQWEAWYAANQ